MTTGGVIALLVAAVGGAAVGLERQWSGHAEGPDARFAGIRTFTMMGAIGALGGMLWTAGLTAPAVILLAGAVGIVVAGYAAGSRQDIDGTTEVAALIVIAAGVLSGIGSITLSSGIIAITTLLLVEKTRLHALVGRIDDAGLRSGVRFAVMALVILPLLPEGPFGPLGGIRPRQLWALVLFFSGLSFAGYVARRMVGPGRGYLVTGLIGGLVSSTNVTFTFARASRSSGSIDRALAAGAIAANAMLYPRVLAATLVLNPEVARALSWYLVAPALVAAAACLAAARRATPGNGPPPVEERNPLQLGSALQMAAIFQAVLILVDLADRFGGDSGVLTSAAILGLTDVDALTISMATRVAESSSAAVAATGIAVGVTANTAMKLALSLVFGTRTFRLAAGGALAAMLIVLGAAVAAAVF